MIDRRRFLAASAAVGAGACAGDTLNEFTTATTSTEPISTTPVSPPATATTTEPVDPVFSPEAGSAPFGLGVTSGDPTMDGVVLWTRLVDGASGNPVTQGEAAVSYVVSRRIDMSAPAASGQVVTSDDIGHSVHAVVDGLDPNTTWFYRFEFDGAFSPVGRTRTLRSSGSARLVVASCQNYEDGHFTAWRHAAAEEADLIVHVGDTIYTRGGIAPTVRTHGDGRPTDLASFRRRYSLYWADPDLQIAHASAPWCSVWDDNEVVSNYAGTQGPDGEANEDFAAVQRAAYQAWWEHHPVRLAPPSDDSFDIHRRVDLGSVATLWLLDGRQHRSPQVCDRLDSVPAIERCSEVDDDERTMLGSAQEQWLSAGLAAVESSWQLIAQQTVVADFSIDVGPVTGINNDQWDGYEAPRERLFRSFGDRNVVVLSGDIHAGAVARLRSGDQVIATEIVTPSISSKIDPLLALGLTLTVANKDDVAHFDVRNHGYVVVDIDHDHIMATFRHVDAGSSSSSVKAGPLVKIDRDRTFTVT